MTRITWKTQDITHLVTLVTVEQSMVAAGREARIGAIYAPGDSRFSLLNPACGDAVAVTAGGTTLFSGTIERVEWDSQSMLLTMICFEPSSLLAKNEIYRAFSGTPKEIAAALCHACKLPIDSLWDKPGKLFIPPSCGRTMFSILREAYGEHCITESKDGALVVRPVGAESYDLHYGAVFSLTSAHSCENLVTGASVISAKGETLAAVTQPQWESDYGLRRRVYAQTGAQSQAAAQAQQHLIAPAFTGEMVLPGDPDIRCGAFVTPNQGMYGLGRQYMIQRVLHRLESGIFTTTIGMVKQ